MAQGDLTTLDNVKAWLGITNNGSDAVLSRLIGALSSSIRTSINRFSLFDQEYTEIRDGTGTNAMVLNNWPVNSVSLVGIGNAVIPPGINVDRNRTAGWYLSPYDGNPPGNAQTIQLAGYNFEYGVQNAKITYRAGYRTVETLTVPGTPYKYEALQPNGSWAVDGGVVYESDGVALTKVASSPTTGQYSLTSTVGEYQFAAGDTGQTLIITYSYVPRDLEQVCIEWVSERNVYRTRIGVRSKSLSALETISFDMSGIPHYVEAVLVNYRNVMPIL